MKLKLITPSQLKKLKRGTELFSISGERVVVGQDYIDDDTRYGFLAYGFKLPDKATKFNWDTSK